MSNQLNSLKWLIMLVASFLVLTGCEKISNSAKNLQSDWVGLDRKIEIYTCHTGERIKSYQGSVRINPDDQLTEGTSFLVDGKKLHTNMCYVVTELGITEQPLSE
ncbi:hypothetical protein [Thiomicrospira sp. WB1]|uniref:hypothetical protein n=1 Tax=Thiomicrospira sp. WB1 TaxID=1685380 RepID=UPI000745F7BB|nr:hypothetical protein [Thiomicrospira sp. WB1]KUJ71943.1 hypothetical protein AVO41_05690 [Thiomicrospira sp. WB1]